MSSCQSLSLFQAILSACHSCNLQLQRQHFRNVCSIDINAFSKEFPKHMLAIVHKMSDNLPFLHSYLPYSVYRNILKSSAHFTGTCKILYVLKYTCTACSLILIKINSKQIAPNFVECNGKCVKI